MKKAKLSKRTRIANMSGAEKFGIRPPDLMVPPTGSNLKQSDAGGASQPDYFREDPKPTGTYNTVPQDSIRPDRVTLSVRMRTNPIRGLTPERMVSLLDQWRIGRYREAGMMWDAMERRDPLIKLCKNKRDKSVSRHGYDVVTLKDVDESDKAMAEEQREFLQAFYDNVTATNALEPDEQGGASTLMRQMMDAVGKRYSVHEIVWQPKDDGTLSAKFIWCPIWWFEGTRGKLRFLDSEFQAYGRDMVPGEWLVTVGDGIMESLSMLFLLRHRAWQAWSSVLDKFGMPGIHAKSKSQKGSREWEAAREAIDLFAEEWAVVTSADTEIALLEAKAAMSGGSGFTDFMERADRAIIQLWRGGDLGTQSSANATGASLQGDEGEILETDDARLIEEALTNHVSRYALQWKFGDAKQLAYIKLRTTPRQNLKDDVLVDTFLLTNGAPMGIKATLERYGRSLPSDDDELMKAPVQMAQEPVDGEDTEYAKKPSDKKDKAKLANEVPKKTLHASASAIASDLEPVLSRLERIMQIQDSELMESKLKKFLSDIDGIKADMMHDPAFAHELQKVMASAWAKGISKKVKP